MSGLSKREAEGKRRSTTLLSLSLSTRPSFCGCWREEASKVFGAVGEAEKRDTLDATVKKHNTLDAAVEEGHTLDAAVKKHNTFSLSLSTRPSFCGCWREEASKVFDAVGEAEKKDNTFSPSLTTGTFGLQRRHDSSVCSLL